MTLVSRYALSPEAIEPRSLALIEELVGPSLPAAPADRLVAKRLLYAAGDVSFVDQIRIHPDAVAAGVAALRAGAPIFADVKMVLAGVNRTLSQRLGCRLHTAIDDPAVTAHARAQHLPRAVEAIRSLGDDLGGAVVAIGNAPTALLALLDLVDAGLQPPALVVGVPVGFVAAAESKAELVERRVPFVTVLGTRGGSPLAAAAVNALLSLAAESPSHG
ncbi:MAG: precorrin-8X methylmutase [Chloroflexi bacterium]|nr:precorrin-8X methylmutase [Chloroflexota bacterium]